MLSSIIFALLFLSNVYGEFHWSYPEDISTDSWSQEDNYCGSDYLFQSPINIDETSGDLQSCSSPLDWEIKTETNIFKVKNTGHNIQIVPICCDISNEDSGDEEPGEPDSDDDPEAANVESGENFGVLSDNFDYIDDGSYCLDSFHIHWGKNNNEGSEHQFNSQKSVMEMHFVHYQCDYKTVQEALNAYNPNEPIPTLAVVGVLFKIGEANPFIQKICDNVNSLKNADDETTITFSNNINMFDVIPIDDNNEIMGNYFHYFGSLTTPPCTPTGL